MEPVHGQRDEQDEQHEAQRKAAERERVDDHRLAFAHRLIQLEEVERDLRHGLVRARRPVAVRTLRRLLAQGRVAVPAETPDVRRLAREHAGHQLVEPRREHGDVRRHSVSAHDAAAFGWVLVTTRFRSRK